MNLDARIYSQRRGGKLFDAVWYQEVTYRNRYPFEAEVIYRLKPPLNRFYNPAVSSSPTTRAVGAMIAGDAAPTAKPKSLTVRDLIAAWDERKINL